MIDVLVTCTVAALMGLTIIFDLRFMRIPNWLSLVGIAVFAGLVSWTLPLDEALWRVGIATIALVIGIVVFAMGVVGAGDVKILSTLLLFVPTAQLSMFFLTFSAAMVVAILVVVLARKSWEREGASWAFLRNEKRLPMGLAIGAAGLINLIG